MIVDKFKIIPRGASGELGDNLGNKIHLSPTQYLLVRFFFLEYPWILFSLDGILDLLKNYTSGTEAIPKMVGKVRGKIHQVGLENQLSIVSHIGRGYYGKVGPIHQHLIESKIEIDKGIFFFQDLGIIFYDGREYYISDSLGKILETLLMAGGRILSKEYLYNLLRVEKRENLRNIDSNISLLRKILNNIKPLLGNRITTVFQEGYRWE